MMRVFIFLLVILVFSACSSNTYSESIQTNQNTTQTIENESEEVTVFTDCAQVTVPAGATFCRKDYECFKKHAFYETTKYPNPGWHDITVNCAQVLWVSDDCNGKYALVEPRTSGCRLSYGTIKDGTLHQEGFCSWMGMFPVNKIRNDGRSTCAQIQQGH